VAERFAPVPPWVTEAVPEISLNAGCDWTGTPDVVMYATQLCEADVMLSMPPSVEAVGSGKSLPTIVPHAGAALTLLVPVCVKKFLVVVVLPARRAGAGVAFS
jgi:hypothetical protein